MKASALRKNIKWGFVFQLSAVISLILVYIFQWITMINNPSLRTGTDFIIFYSVGKIAQEYGITNSYNILLQQDIQEDVLGFPLADKQVLVYNHIPYLIPILSLIIIDDYSVSFIVWILLMFGVYIISSFLLINTLPFEGNRLSFFFGTILFYPLFQSLLLGQDTAILFFGCVIWYIGLIKQKSWLAAIGLALTSVRPHLCLAFAIPMILCNFQIRWKFIVSISLLILTSILMLSWQGVLDFLYMLQISATGTLYGFHQKAMFNLIGLISNTLPFLEPNNIRMFGWVGYIGSIVFLSFIWRKRETSIGWLISVSILITLFFAPHLHYHDLSLLAIPLILLYKENKYGGKILLTISLILLIFRPLYHILPYFLYANLAWELWKKKN